MEQSVCKSTATAASASKLAQLSPAYFGMVMATGIVSLAANMRGFPALAQALFILNTFLYALLWVFYAARLYLYKKHFLDDLQSHLKATGFFTVVAATNVLGSQFLVFTGNINIAIILLTLGVLLWLLLTYLIFTIFTIKVSYASAQCLFIHRLVYLVCHFYWCQQTGLSSGTLLAKTKNSNGSRISLGF